MAVGRQPQHHGDAAIVVERGAENAPAAARRRVVVLDVVEDERLAGAGTLRQAHDGAELDVPVDLGVDLGELVLRLERGDPAAQITEGDGLAFDGHVLGSGLEHATLYTTRERADDPAIHRFERSLSFRWMPAELELARVLYPV